MYKKTLILTFLFLTLLTPQIHARSTKNRTIGLMGMGNIQLLDTLPEIDPGPGGGVYFDYRFNQRFSIQIDAWATTHNATGRSDGDGSIELLGIPTFTIKLYFMDDENSRWDPFAGLGIGVYALSEGAIENGTNGVGLGAHIDVGFDYYLGEIFSLGFSGVFRSTAIITSLGNDSNATAVLPYSLIGRVGFHF